MNFRKIALVVFSISFVWVLMFGGFSKEAEADDANLVLWHNYGNGGGLGTNSEAGNSKNVNDLVTKNNGLVRKMDYNSLIDNRGQVCNNPPFPLPKICVDPDSTPLPRLHAVLESRIRCAPALAAWLDTALAIL